MPKIGEVLSTAFENYIVEAKLGEGGAGEVYRVRNEADELFALKVLKRDATGKASKRFRNELNFCAADNHKNIIKVLDYGKAKESFYVMPLYAASLRAALKADLKSGDALVLFAQMLDGVEAAHLKGVWHRDLKPENVLLSADRSTLVVADFGIAHFETDMLRTEVQTIPSDRLANFRYAAPEQREQGRVVDHRADIYALGLILHELMTLEVPQGLGVRKIAQAHPDLGYLDDLSESMRAHDAVRRPQTIGDVKNQLIARRLDFVKRQELDRKRNLVVTDSDETDPLILAPPVLQDVRFDGRSLLFQLSEAVNSEWVYEFQNMSGFGAIMGRGPENVSWHGNEGVIYADEYDAQRMIDYFKQWLATTNQQYARSTLQKRQKAIAALRAKLAAEVQQEENRIAVQSKLRW